MKKEIDGEGAHLIWLGMLKSSKHAQCLFEFGNELRSEDIFFDWIARGLRNGKSHPCFGCAHGTVPCGIIIPLIYDITKECHEKIASVLGENLSFFFDEKPLLSIESLALYCSTGNSHNVKASLRVTLYTEDGAETQHHWDTHIPKTSFISRRNKAAVLNAEVARLLANDLYSPMTRQVLQKLMDRICVGFPKIRKTALMVQDQIQKSITDLKHQLEV